MTNASDIVVQENAPRRIGIVESDARDKTRKVVIAYSSRHPKYGKYIKRRTVLQVHDESNQSHAGDRVEVAECRPISKTKSWVLTRVVEKAIGFLTHPKVRGTTLARKRDFLREKKGMTSAEVGREDLFGSFFPLFLTG